MRTCLPAASSCRAICDPAPPMIPERTTTQARSKSGSSSMLVHSGTPSSAANRLDCSLPLDIMATNSYLSGSARTPAA